MKSLILAALAGVALGGSAVAQQFDYGFAGGMGKANRADLAPLTLGSGKPVAEAEDELKSGACYKLLVVADGSAEIRPMGVHSLQFDAAAEAEITFIAVTPGCYTLSIPGSSGDSLKAVFNIR